MIIDWSLSAAMIYKSLMKIFKQPILAAINWNAEPLFIALLCILVPFIKAKRQSSRHAKKAWQGLFLSP